MSRTRVSLEGEGILRVGEEEEEKSAGRKRLGGEPGADLPVDDDETKGRNVLR